MHDFENLKHMAGAELREYNKKERLSGSDLNAVHMLSGIYKNLCKIAMMEEGESHRSMDGSYDSYDGTSGRRGRGRNGRFVSRDGGSYESYDSYDSYDSRDGYSDRGSYGHDEGREHMIDQIERMMEQAHNTQEKEALRRCISNLKRA